MTVTNTSRRADYSGDGSTTEFTVTFQFFEISVYVDGELQIAGSDYVVSQEEPGLTGAILFLAANGATPANGTQVVILGTTSPVQSVDYVNNDDFPAETHEAALDRLTMIAQEQQTRFEGVVRAVDWHAPIDPLDFAANPSTIVFVNNEGNVSLQSAEQILGGVDIGDAIEAAAAAASALAAAEVARDAASASALAAAASAELAAEATGVLTADAHYTGFPEFEKGFRVGQAGEGDSVLEFHDDTSDTWRSFWWDDTEHDWRVEDASGSTRRLWHEGNTASEAEAVGGTEHTKGMTALRVAQAIAALASEGAFPAGTRQLFQNSSAPPGWSKAVDLEDYGIRVTSGPVGMYGSFSYSTVFASRTPTGTVGARTLSQSMMPAHSHSASANRLGILAGGGLQGGSGAAYDSISISIGNNGSGASHDHSFTGSPMAFNVKTVDVIIAEKD